MIGWMKEFDCMYRAEVELRGRMLKLCATECDGGLLLLEAFEAGSAGHRHMLGVRRYCHATGEWQVVDFVLPPEGHYCVDPVEAAGEGMVAELLTLRALREL